MNSGNDRDQTRNDEISRLMEFTISRAADGVFWVGPDSHIVHANQAACEMLGWSYTELTAMSVSDIDPYFPAERWPAHWNELKQKGMLRFESAHRTKSGRIVPVEITVNYIEHEGRSFNVAFARDISERNAARDMLAQSKLFLTTIIDAIPDALLVIDKDYRVILANRAARDFAGGIDPAAAEMRCHELSHDRASPCKGPLDTCPFLEVLQNRGPVVVHHQHYDSAGAEHTVEITAAPVFNEEGQVVQIIEACRDITERIRAERALEQATEQLKRSNEDLEQFAYVASHDLQEPLRIISGFLNLLKDRYQEQFDERAKGYIHHVTDAADRMSNLIRDLLEYSRIDSKGKELQNTSSAEALAHAVSNLRERIVEAHGTITFDELPVVLSDPTHLMQLFQNLIGNALKFRSPDRPCKIHISAQMENGGWRFSVQDNGIGIEPQYQERIFNMFQRLHPSSMYAGTGIGLAVCKKIVARLGGRIWVESEPGKGSTFHFSLGVPSV